MPTTVPIITLLSEAFIPELPESLSFPSSFGAPLDADAESGACSTLVVLIVLVTEVPPLTNTTVLTIIWVTLLAGLVEAGGTETGVVDGFSGEGVESVTLWISDVDTAFDAASEVSLGTKVVEGSSSFSSVGGVEVDTGSGVLEVRTEDSGVSLAGAEEVILSGALEDVGMDTADVELAEAPVPLGTICRYRSALSTLSANTRDSDVKKNSSILRDARFPFISIRYRTRPGSEVVRGRVSKVRRSCIAVPERDVARV